MQSILAGGKALIDVEHVLNKAKIGDKMKVADLGCGSMGRYVFGASKLVGKHGKVYAVNILKTALETIGRIARQNNINNIETVWSDLEVFNATKIEPNSLDVSLLINTLYQSNKRVEIIRETIRLTKKNGIIIVVEWKNSASPFGPPVEARVDKDVLIKGCKKLGLKLEEDFFIGQYHYGLIFLKI